MSKNAAYVFLAVVMLTCFAFCLTAKAKADSTPININTKRTILVESFIVVCETSARSSVCTEIVTEGQDKGKTRSYSGPGSLLLTSEPDPFAEWDSIPNELDLRYDTLI